MTGLRNYISRLNGFQQYARENIELMRTGLRTGYLPPQCTLTELDVQLKAQMVTDPPQVRFTSLFYISRSHR